MSTIIYQDKKILYEVIGRCSPVTIIHGNTASGKISFGTYKKSTKHFQVIDLLSKSIPNSKTHIFQHEAHSPIWPNGNESINPATGFIKLTTHHESIST